MKYKKSFYSIITDKIPNTDTQIVFGTRTSRMISLQSKYVKLLENHKFDEIPNDILAELIDGEIIVPEFVNELQEVANLQKMHSRDISNGYFHFTIMSSANCQLGCNYCGQEHTNNFMNKNLIKSTLERMEKNIIEKDVKELHISWFGGEPLMGYSKMKELNKGVKELTKKHNCKYSSHLISNGLSLKKKVYLELANDFNCEYIDITLDGTKEYHDKRRDTKKHNPTFDIILNNIIEITSVENFPVNGCKISIRCNVDDSNSESVIPLIELLAEHGLQDKVYFYTAAIYSWGNDAHLSITKEDYAVKEIDYFLKLYELGFLVKPIPSVRHEVCAAVSPNYELIDPFGRVYNCTETPLVPAYGKEMILGNLNKDIHKITQFEDRPYVNWHEEIKDSSNGFWCSGCNILPLCGGRCPKSWKDGIPACPSMKFNMEDRLMLANYVLQNERAKSSQIEVD